jgi:hypothetical protein
MNAIRITTLSLVLIVLCRAEVSHAAEGKIAPPATKGGGQISNGAVWKKGWPLGFENTARPAVESAMLYEPTENDWKYAHHQSLAAFKHQLFAIWSNALRDEDSPGQRVLCAVRNETGAWGRPRILFQPDIDPDGRLRILTAAGFHAYRGTLVAYAGDYSIDRKSTRLLARTSQDGKTWSEVRDLHVPICPNHGPQSTASGRLIIAGNTAFPYTDDPAGLSGWKMTGVYPASIEPFQDNPSTFWDVAKRMRWPNLCEGAFYQTDDGVLHMLFRVTDLVKVQGVNLWESRSADNGATWDPPRETAFSNTDAKFHFGRLPDGRFYYVGNPVGGGRTPLVLSLSRDGLRFDRHYILGDKHYQRRFEGRAKGGEYGYPHSVIYDGHLYVIVSRQKEAVEVLCVALSDLKEP